MGNAPSFWGGDNNPPSNNWKHKIFISSTQVRHVAINPHIVDMVEAQLPDLYRMLGGDKINTKNTPVATLAACQAHKTYCANFVYGSVLVSCTLYRVQVLDTLYCYGSTTSSTNHPANLQGICKSWFCTMYLYFLSWDEPMMMNL
jgi:hypothetical protein